MKITTGILSLFSIISTITDSARAATLGKKYNLLSTKGLDHFASLSDFSLDAAQPVTFNFDDVDFTTVTLTDDQAQTLAEVVTKAGDLFEPNSIIKLPPVTYSLTNSTSTEQTETTPATGTTVTSTFITSIPVYSGTLYGQDVAIMDAYIYPNVAMLNGFKVDVVQSFAGNAPCLAHGTNVAEVIAQMFDPSKTDLKFLNFAVFDCTGNASIGVIGEAISAIIKYKKHHGKHRGLTVNFSGTGEYSAILNSLFQKLTDNDITVVVAAGNYHESCDLASPASAASTMPIQSVGATEGQTLSYYSDYATPSAPCVDLYLPGCLPMTNPTTGEQQIGCGTSFACPMESGRVMVFKQTSKKASPAEIKTAMHADTVTMPGPNGLQINSITEDMAFSWKTQQSQATKGKHLRGIGARTKPRAFG